MPWFLTAQHPHEDAVAGLGQPAVDQHQIAAFAHQHIECGARAFDDGVSAAQALQHDGRDLLVDDVVFHQQHMPFDLLRQGHRCSGFGAPVR